MMPVVSKAKVSGLLRRAFPAVQAAFLRLQAQPWLRIAVLLLAGVIAALRFFHLEADFPNDSPWAIDQAKFTDEGWWAGAAVAHAITGHWYIAGDYNPAVALPVWPLLLSAVFHFTGVSILAARSLSVAFSVATLALVYLLVRRYTHSGSHLPAVCAVYLLALSPFAFVFSRLAILDALVVFEFCLTLLLVSFATPRRAWPLAVAALLVFAMLLTKTTAAALVPAILWLALAAKGRNLRAISQAILAVAVAPVLLLKGYAALVAALGHGADYKYFFQVNAMEDFDPSQSLATLAQLLHNCFWIDRVLYPAGLAILVLSVVWIRKLWSNPLYAGAWLAFAAQALYIFRRQEDYAPRYFLVMLVPLIWIVVLALDEFLAHPVSMAASPSSAVAPTPSSSLPQLSENSAKANRPRQIRAVAAALLLVAIAASLTANARLLAQFLVHRQSQFYDAAQSIRAIIRSHPEQRPMMLGVSGSQLSLMTGIPSIGDGDGAEDGSERVAHDKPGWYLVWTGLSTDVPPFLSRYQLEEVASYPVFDDPGRTPLILCKVMPRAR